MVDLLERRTEQAVQIALLNAKVNELQEIFTNDLKRHTENEEETFERIEAALAAIKTSLDALDKQTAKWKNIFWGVALALSFFISIYQELSNLLSKLK